MRKSANESGKIGLWLRGGEGSLWGMAQSVWINGTLMASEDAAISPFDHGWTVGNGVFETMLAYDGVLFAFDHHWERLDGSASVMGLALPARDSIRVAIDEILKADHLMSSRARVRVTVTGGLAPMGSAPGEAPPTVAVAAIGISELPPWTDVAVVPFTRNPTGALAGVKATSYGENVVALAHAQARGAGEALFANTSGELCEGSGSNVFVVVDAVLKTPPLTSGCLAGVTRALVIKVARGAGIEVREEAIQLSQLADAEEAFLTSTTREVQAIREVDGNALVTVEGPVTLAVRTAFQRERDRLLAE